VKYRRVASILFLNQLFFKDKVGHEQNQRAIPETSVTSADFFLLSKDKTCIKQVSTKRPVPTAHLEDEYPFLFYD